MMNKITSDYDRDGEFYIADLLLHVRMGKKPHEKTMEFIANALSAICRGESARDVLKLPRGKSVSYVPLQRALAVEIAYLYCGKYDDAIEIIAGETGKAFSTISNNYDAWQRDAKALLAGMQDDNRLMCACRVEDTRDTHASLDGAIAAVAEEYGLPSSDIERWHSEYLREALEDLSECKPPKI